MKASDRKMRILKVIIDDFIDTAQPVGSRTIAKKYPLGVSSATIRNEMADLEDLGYLTQPHTSAGRIPSDMGYRIYVDSLLNSERDISKEKMELIRGLLINRVIEVEDIIEEAVELLSKLTGGTALITMPQFKKSRLENLKLVRINDSKVLLIFVVDSGVYKTLPISFLGTTQEMLDELTNHLLANMKGSNIEDINIRMISSIKKSLPEYAPGVDYLVPLFKKILQEFDDVDIYIHGSKNILNMPEFYDVQKASKLLNVLENKELMYKLLEADTEESEGIKVKIGAEIGIEELNDCSMISTSYKFNGSYVGRIGIVGVKRMDYGLMLSVIDYVRETLSELFLGINL